MAETCPICNPDTASTAEKVASLKVAEHIKDKASEDEAHAEWLEENTEDGTKTEAYEALQD